MIQLQRVSDQERQLFVDLHDAGYSLNEIAKLAIRSHTTVSAHLRKAGVRSMRTSAQEVARFRELYLDGCSYKEIGDVTDRSPSTVARQLRRTDVEIRSRYVSLEDRETFKRLYSSGLSLREIGDVTGYWYSIVGKHLRADGVKLRDNHTSSADLDARILELYDAEYGGTAIARMIGRHASFVYRRLRANGVTPRPRPKGGYPGQFRMPHAVIVLTRGLYEKGYSSAEIGRIMNCAQTTVIYRLRAAGVPLRSPSESHKLAWQKSHPSRRLRAGERLRQYHQERRAETAVSA